MDDKIETNLRAGHGLIGDSGAPLEIDIYLPDYKLGFEYQVTMRGGRKRREGVGGETDVSRFGRQNETNLSAGHDLIGDSGAP